MPCVNARALVRLVTGAVCASVAVVAAAAPTWAVTSGPFSYLEGSLTQELYATAPSASMGYAGGLAFGPDGALLVGGCRGSGDLHRFGTPPVPVHGTAVRQEQILPSRIGCGLANGESGRVYSNTAAGVVEVDPATGALLAGPAGPAGNGLGIAYDAGRNRFVYAGESGLAWVRSDLSGGGALTGDDAYDGVSLDPTGQYVFAADGDVLDVIDAAGTLVQRIPFPAGSDTGSGTDGVAFHVAGSYVVTNNTDGTMTRLTFPQNDYSKEPERILLASGGFRGDLVQVGADGCLFVTQDGARYADGTVTDEQSIVRVCGGFAPPPGNDRGSWVALGDGVAAGDGAGPSLPGSSQSTPQNECHRSDAGYAALVARSAGLALVNVACAGARVADLLEPNAEGNLGADGKPEPAQLDAVTEEARWVTLTTGAADLGTASLWERCLATDLTGGHGSRRSAHKHRQQPSCATDQELAATLDQRLAALAAPAGPLVQSLQEIQRRAPHAQVVVTGYPLPFGAGCSADGCQVGTVRSPDGTDSSHLLVDRATAAWLDDLVSRLDDALRQATEVAGGAVRFADVRGAFAGHGLCDDGTAWLAMVSGVLVPGGRNWGVAPSSLLPTAEGQAQGYLAVVRDVAGLFGPQVG